MLKGLFYIFLFLALGELIRYLTDIPLPGNVIGMALIFIALRSGILTLKMVKVASHALTRNLALFFVPAGVGIILYSELLIAHWVLILIAAVVSTILVLLVTGLVHGKNEPDE